MKSLKDYDLYEVYKAWVKFSGPFRCFIRSTNFVSLKHYPNFEIDEIDFTIDKKYVDIKKNLENINFSNTLVMLDLNAVDAIRIGFMLQKNENIKPIITFNCHLHEHGLVGSKKYINLLMKYWEENFIKEPNGFIFILDNDRFNDYSEEKLKENFNNQYEITEEDVPLVEMLEELSYEKVLYMTNNLKEDAESYICYLKDNNINVEVIEVMEEKNA